MADYAGFRQRLDAVLRTLDVKQVQDFLMAEGQWGPGQPTDPEFAMWMMIAGSPNLRDLHDKAYQWLVSHGHEAEANALLRRDKSVGKKQGKTSPPKHERAGSKPQSGKIQKKPDSQPRSKGHP